MANEDRKVTLQAEVDTSKAEAGFNRIGQSAEQMATKVSREGAKAADGVRGVTAGADGAAKDLGRAERSIINSIQRLNAAARAGGKDNADYIENLARARNVYTSTVQAELAALRETEAARAASAASLGKVGQSAAQTAAALRLVPAQFTDIVVSLQAGQQPLTVLLQQGGQLKDMFGGIGPAARAVGGYILGLVNPFTLAAAAAGAVAFAYSQGTKEADAYNKALILSGNASGESARSLAEMARNMAAIKGTQGEAANALAQIAATGEVAGKNLQQFAQVAIDLEKRAGIPVENTAKAFEELGKKPVEASLKLTEQYRYLTGEVFNQIKALEDQGKTAAAAEVAQRAYADAMAGRTAQLQQNLGTIERAWEAIAKAAKKAWDNMLNVGRPESIADQLGKAEERLRRAQAAASGFVQNDGGAAFGRGGASAARAKQEIEAASAVVDSLREQRKLLYQNAQRQAEAVRLNEAQVKWQKEGDKYLSDAQKLEKEIARIRQEGRAARASEADIEKRVQASRDAAAKKEGSNGIAGAERRLDLSAIQNDARDQVAMLDAQQRALQLRRQAGLVDEQTYYAQRIKYVQEANDVETKSIQAQIDLLKKQDVKGKESLEIRKQIGDLETKLRLQRVKGQNSVNEISQEADLANKRQEASLQSLNVESERYIANLKLRADREIALVGMSDRQRSYVGGLQGIEDRFRQQRDALRDRLAFTPNITPEVEAQIRRRMELLDQEQKEETRIYDEKFNAIARAQGDWTNGAQRAFQNYADSAANVAGSVEQAFTSAFKGLEDALVSFATTGKADFKSLANSIIADLIRIQVRGALAGVFGKGDGFNWAKLLGGVAGAFGGTAGQAAAASALPGDSLSNMISLTNGFGTGAKFSAGGYTGAGGKYQPAGIVHRGEYVMTKEATDRLGLGFLNRLNRLNGYAAGGMVGAGPASNDVNWTILNHSSTPMTSETVQIDPQNRALVIRDARRAMAADVADAGSRFSRTLARTTTTGRRR